MQRETKFLQLTDGRKLAFAEYGDPEGEPAIYCHGFPGSHLEAELFDEAARQCRVRVIAADRNGLGQSDPKAHRELIDWSTDMAALADHLNIERFHLIGVSGGGPYAIACAHQLSDRIEGLTLVCPLGQLDHPDLLKTMQWPAQLNFRSIRMTPWLSHLSYRFAIIPVAQIWPQWIYQMMLTVVPETDKKVLKKPKVRSVITDSLREAIRQGAAGVLDEMALYTRPWNLDLSKIDLPVQLWHGTADTTVPLIHGRSLAEQLPNCETNYVEGEGHFSLPFERMDEILG
ncbi:MAG: alpha/beta hydrolase [Candidatus Thiodiazotropha sp.]